MPHLCLFFGFFLWATSASPLCRPRRQDECGGTYIDMVRGLDLEAYFAPLQSAWSREADGTFTIPRGFAIGHLDEDNANDIVLGSRNREIWYWKGLLGGGFLSRPTLLFTVDEEISGLALGDVDGDGTSEIMITGYEGGLHIFKCTSIDVLQVPCKLIWKNSSAVARRILALGDLGDGRWDALFAEFQNFRITRGGPGIVFRDSSEHENLYRMSKCTLGDLDVDTLLDLICVGDDGFLHFYRGLRSGLFEQVLGRERDPFFDFARFGNQTLTFSAYVPPALADLDGDGQPEVIGLGRDFHIRVLQGRPREGLQQVDLPATHPFATQSRYPSPAVGDLNSDGHDDIVVGDSDGFLHLFQGKGNGEFEDAKRIHVGGLTDLPGEGRIYSGNPLNPAIGDLDGDQIKDIVVGTGYNGQQHGLYFLKGQGNLSFRSLKRTNYDPFVNISTNVGDGPFPSIGDFDGDGIMDLVIGNYNKSLHLVRGLKGGGFALVPILSALRGSGFYLPSLFDYNKDGIDDLILGNQAGTFSVLLGPLINRSLLDSEALHSSGFLVTSNPTTAAFFHIDDVLHALIGDGVANELSLFSNASRCTTSCGGPLRGICSWSLAGPMQCTCLTGKSDSETMCAGCATGYYGKDCMPCPGAPDNICNGRGYCDDFKDWSHFGRGSCTCSEPFKGHDCSEGKCPAGFFELGGQCHVDGLTLVGAGLFFVALTAVLLILPTVLWFHVAIEDVALQGGSGEEEEGIRVAVVIRTMGPHWIQSWRKAAVPVSFRSTGHPVLDAKLWTVAHLSKNQLRMFDALGQPITTALDTSQGWLHMPFPQTLLYLHLGRMPIGVLLPSLLACSIALGYRFTFGPTILGAKIAAAAVLAALYHLIRRQSHGRTPMQSSLQEYRTKLAAHRPHPIVTARGASRAILSGQLSDLHQFFQAYIRSRPMYYVASNVVKPLTAEAKVSFAELVGPHTVNYFVSHYWGTAFRDFVQSVIHHAKSSSQLSGGPWQAIAYWICTFSNSQWSIEEELGSGWQESSFYLALSSGVCSGTVMILDEHVLPLTRAWCLFELLQTAELQRADPHFAGLCLCTATGVLQRGTAGVDVAMRIAERLSTIRVEDADASEQADKDMIMQLVAAKPGGFPAMNGFIRATLCKCLHTTSLIFETKLSGLLSALGEASDFSEEPGFSPMPQAACPTQQVLNDKAPVTHDYASRASLRPECFPCVLGRSLHIPV